MFWPKNTELVCDNTSSTFRSNNRREARIDAGGGREFCTRKSFEHFTSRTEWGVKILLAKN